VWPLGQIAVPTPGTYVSIMSLVDSSFVNAPEKPTPGTVGANEYTNRAQQIIFQAYKVGSGTKLGANTGTIYIVKPPLAGAGGVGDTGTIVTALTPGQTFVLSSAPENRNVFNLYEYYIDADTAADGCQVTAIIQ
jgi:hypothetical protein